jgi:hypothetical protein
MKIAEPDNPQSVRAALEHAEAQAEWRRRVVRGVLMVLGVSVLMFCLLAMGAVR